MFHRNNFRRQGFTVQKFHRLNFRSSEAICENNEHYAPWKFDAVQCLFSCRHCMRWHHCCLFYTPTVQDVAFQLERLVGGLYVYNRQCHKTMKQAAVFPIEVQLSVHPEPPPPTEGEGDDGEGEGEGEGEKGKAVGNEPQEDLLIQTD